MWKTWKNQLQLKILFTEHLLYQLYRYHEQRDFQLKKYSIPAGRYANALSAKEAEEKESAAMKMG